LAKRKTKTIKQSTPKPPPVLVRKGLPVKQYKIIKTKYSPKPQVKPVARPVVKPKAIVVVKTTKTIMPKKSPLQTQQTPRVEKITYGGTPINVQQTGQNLVAQIKLQSATTEAEAGRKQPLATQNIVYSEIEGNVLSTNLGIKTSLTSFVPTQQEAEILAHMEAQKLKEKNQAKAQSDWERQRASLDAKIVAMEAQRQKSEDFRNRSTEEKLQNFIKVQLDKERTQDTGTLFTESVMQEGFDPNQPSTIPPKMAFFKSGMNLNTVEAMAAAGLAPRIIEMRMKSFNVTQAKTTALEPNTVVPPLKKNTINYDGQQNKFAFQSKKLQGTRFVPPEAENQNSPVNITSKIAQPAITPKFANTNQYGIILQSVKAPQKQQGTIKQTKVRAAFTTAGVDELPTKTNKGMGLALLAGVLLLG